MTCTVPEAEQAAGGNINTFALLFNVRWQPDIEYASYVLAGIGPAYQQRDGKSSVTHTDLDRTGVYFGWQVGTGFSALLATQLALEFGLRYFDAQDQSQYGGVLQMRYLFSP